MNSAIPPTTKIRKNSTNVPGSHQRTAGKTSVAINDTMSASSYSSWFKKIRWTPAAA